MAYRLTADGLVLVHLLFIVFVMAGGLLLLRWPRLCWVHLPAVAWGFSVEMFHWMCPLTEWENRLRVAAGEQGYANSFVEHHVWPLIYPAGLTPQVQVGLGGLVVVVNVLVYGWVWWRRG